MRIGCGAIIRDAFRNVISSTSGSYGTGSAFAVEILTMELGHQHGWSVGYRNIVCCMDCPQALMVLQPGAAVDDYWAREDIARVRGLLQQDWQVLLLPIPRDKNSAADSLARHAAREGSPQCVWGQPPSSLIYFLLQDFVS